MNVDMQAATSAVQMAIGKEINGLEIMHDNLDHWVLADVLELLHECDGRIIFTGVGKSAHVARKAAATFSSTGSPAYFVHPTEASHGDLGMISEDDVVVALSKSGESKELADVIEYCARFDIPLVAVTCEEHSTLSIQSSHLLLVPKASEANEIINAPTTSSTMMMVLLDAVAIGLIEMNQFQVQDFGVLHPGGKLGESLLRVKDYMHTNVPRVGKMDDMRSVLLEITSKGYGCACVIDDNGRLCGIITDGDIRRHIDQKDLLMMSSAYLVMTSRPVVIDPESLMAEALKIMQKRKVTSLVVVEEEKPVGVIHVLDCLRAGII